MQVARGGAACRRWPLTARGACVGKDLLQSHSRPHLKMVNEAPGLDAFPEPGELIVIRHKELDWLDPPPRRPGSREANV